MSRVAIQSIDRATHTVTLANPVGAPHDFFRMDGFEPHPRYFLENSPKFLDAANEFVVAADSWTVSLNLGDGVSPVTSRVVAPTLPELIRIRGTAGHPVRGIRFVGLQFRHTSCPIPDGGYAGIQASFFERRGSASLEATGSDAASESGNERLPAAVDFAMAEDCRVESCEFRQLGGGGIYLNEFANKIEIAHCKFNDIGGCGIMIGETWSRSAADGTSLACRGNVVRDCSVSECGTILLGSVGVWIGIARDTLIADNSISDLPYTGISVGWQWDAVPTGCASNQIRGNHIQRVMLQLSDGGGIYTLGRQPGTILSGNRIHDIPLNAGRAESNGIFMDEGSCDILVAENEIFDVARSPIRFHKAQADTIRKNRLSTSSGADAFRFNATDPTTLDFEDNVIQE